MALIDHFLPPLAFAAMLASEENLANTAFDTARADMERLLDQAMETARRESPDQADDALFAVCAYADEAVLDSAWPGRQAWIRRKLQEERFNTANAGLEFYQRLAQLCAEGGTPAEGELPGPPLDRKRRELLEVYAACLALGFRGQYSGDQLLEKVDRLTGASLQRLLGDNGLAGEMIFPETYATDLPPPEPARMSPALKALILFGGPLLLAMIIYAAYSSLLSAFVSQWLGAL